ncbi:acyltransferase [Cellulomonas sp.]|uniref:acyltransferase n=1 Tax=Cellulomonas sp. TaxID=40001 RepID=UPI003BAD5D48
MMLVQLLVGLLPASGVKNWMLGRLGHDVHTTASIAPTLILGRVHLDIDAHARIGPLNALRSTNLRVGEHAEIGQLNWISAAPFLVSESSVDIAGSLVLGAHSSLTNRHYLDTSGGVQVGAFATVAGVRSVFMTHGIEAADNTLVTRAIRIGDYAMVGGSCKFVPGAVVPDRSIVGMGSVVIRGLTLAGALYAGSPATFKRAATQGAYFSRTVGKVPVRPRTAKAPDATTS